MLYCSESLRLMQRRQEPAWSCLAVVLVGIWNSTWWHSNSTSQLPHISLHSPLSYANVMRAGYLTIQRDDVHQPPTDTFDCWGPDRDQTLWMRPYYVKFLALAWFMFMVGMFMMYVVSFFFFLFSFPYFPVKIVLIPTLTSTQETNGSLGIRDCCRQLMIHEIMAKWRRWRQSSPSSRLLTAS